MLELREDEDECGFDDIADGGRAAADVLDIASPLRHQGKAAFSLVTQGSAGARCGFRVDIEFAAADSLLHRDVHACAGSAITQNRRGQAGLPGKTRLRTG